MTRTARALLAGSLVAMAPAAHAAPCSDLSSQGTIVYAQVGDTQNNLMKRLGRGGLAVQSRAIDVR